MYCSPPVPNSPTTPTLEPILQASFKADIDPRLLNYRMKALPPEIWALVINQLEREDQKTCRTLSKLHHDLATITLFAHITVYFGLWEHGSTLYGPSEEGVSEAELKNAVTWDILRHISLCPDFAKVVRKISVRAYLRNDGELMPMGGDIFHTRPLVTALEALHNLRVFHWHGYSPQLKQDVLTALAQYSGHSLKELHIPITTVTAPCLSAFPSLQELRAVDIPWGRAFDPPLDECSTRAIQMAADGMADTLIRITMPGDVLWGCSIRSMLGLQELEVILPETAGGLGLVLRHCFLLRSLTLYPLAPGEAFSVLQADPGALPDLRALKLICSPATTTSWVEYWHAQALAGFIESKKQLACLDVEVDTRELADEAHFEEPILEAITELPCLEVLGFSLRRASWEPGDIQFFREHVPRGLTALRLSVAIEQTDNDALLHEWLDLIKDRASLRYLHVLDTFRTFDLKQQLLEDPPASLELVGYGPFLRWLVCEGEHDDNNPDLDGHPEYSLSWPLSKVQFRSADDFGCAEWEWLLRWYGAFDMHEMAPGLSDYGPESHFTGFQ